MHLTFQLIHLFAEMISMEGNWEEKADVKLLKNWTENQ